MFLEVNTTYPVYLVAEAAVEYLICLSSSHWHCGTYCWPSKSSSDSLAAKFQNSHKMWSALLASQESLHYLIGSGHRQMGWKQAHFPDYCLLHRGRIRSDQQFPTVAHDMSLFMSRTFSNKMNLIYEHYSWRWVERWSGLTPSFCKSENWNPELLLTSPTQF